MDWIRGKKLGNGSFAAVSLAAPTIDASSVFPPLMAVKYCGVSHSSTLINEKRILDELNGCPEIIRCFGESFTCENGENLYNVLLEYAPSGSLADKINNSSDRSLPEPDVRRYSNALVKGLHYIHTAGYVHCDIKRQNILLGPNGEVKIADFGLAKRAREIGRRNSRWELRGTPLYMSPEMVTSGEQGTEADVWALGCLVAEMLTGGPAWRCSDVAGLLMRIGVGDEVPEIPGDSSDEGTDFLRKCFVKDPRKRWTTEMLLNHPFICGQDSISNQDRQERETPASSTSPRCPFDFPDCTSSAACSTITSLSSPQFSPGNVSLFDGEGETCLGPPGAARLREVACDECPNWTELDGWVRIR